MNIQRASQAKGRVLALILLLPSSAFFLHLTGADRLVVTLGSVLATLLLRRPLLLLAVFLGIFALRSDPERCGALARNLYLDWWDAPDRLVVEAVLSITLTVFLVVPLSLLLEAGTPAQVLSVLKGAGMLAGIGILVVGFLFSDAWLRSRFS